MVVCSTATHREQGLSQAGKEAAIAVPGANSVRTDECRTKLVPDPPQVTAKPHSPAGSPSVKMNLRMRKTHYTGEKEGRKRLNIKAREVGQKHLRHWIRHFPVAQKEDYSGAYIHIIFHEGSHARAGPGNPSG